MDEDFSLTEPRAGEGNGARSDHREDLGSPGSERAYRDGCRCDICTSAHKERSRRYYETRKSRGDGAPRARGGGPQKYEDTVRAIFEWGGMGIGIFDPLPGIVLQKQAPVLGRTGARVVQKHEALQRLLGRVSTTTVYAEFVAALAPVAAAVMLAHGPLEPNTPMFNLLYSVVKRAVGEEPAPYLDLEVVDHQPPSTAPPNGQPSRSSLLTRLEETSGRGGPEE